MIELSKLWDEVRNRLSSEVDTMHFRTWINNLSPVDMSEDRCVLTGPNSFVCQMVMANYEDIMVEKFRQLTHPNFQLLMVFPEEINDFFERESRKNSLHTASRPNGQQYFAVEEEEPAPPPRDIYRGLEPRYTFEAFVRGKSNEMAFAAAQNVSNNPAQTFNPFFIYGGAGLGKTHLMQACARRILDRNPHAKVAYLSSEKFTNELIKSISDKSTKKSEAFRNKYRNIDVLLIDDIQFIARKEATQEEFFHTFNDLFSAQKQIILSSDRPPKDIKHLEERLTSRFAWGLTVDIQPPDYETRMAILINKLKQGNYQDLYVPQSVLEMIAMNVKSNIRELEGALVNLAARSKLTNETEITEEFARKELSRYLTDQKVEPLTVDKIKQKVSDHFNLSITDIESKKRTRKLVIPRHIAMYISRTMTDLSLTVIAESFNRDHSSVLHAIEKIESSMNEDRLFKIEVEEIMEMIRSE